MLPRIVRILQEAVAPIVVVAAPDQDLPPLPEHVAIVRDRVKGRGPLQGLVAGLESLKSTSDAAYVTSCDVPFLRPALVRRMIELLEEHEVAVPQSDGRLHPLAAVYRVRTLTIAEELLASNQLRTALLLERCRTRIVLPEELGDVDPDLSSLRNLNTPEEFEFARQVCPNSIGDPRHREN